MKYKTLQEEFWAGEFGAGYMQRNTGEQIIVSRTVNFARMLRAATGVRSILELGCNIGMNLEALHRLSSAFQLSAVEINADAAKVASDRNVANVQVETIVERIVAAEEFDLTFTSGVLIHIAPDMLSRAYDNLYRLSRRYILVNEYYNPTPTMVNYRGEDDRLFKRDFAGELIDKYGVKLVDYGFFYHRDRYASGSDSTWFLLEK